MNSHLDKAFDLTAQIGAVLCAIDEAYMEDADSQLQNLHSLLRDLTKDLESELILLAEDRKVVDAIYAANAARHSCTLKTGD